jgi:hypothetical protein
VTEEEDAEWAAGHSEDFGFSLKEAKPLQSYVVIDLT